MALGLACGKKSTDRRGDDPKKPTNLTDGLVPTTESVQAKVVNEKCIKCHSSAQSRNHNVDLHDIAAIVKSDGQVGTAVVKAGCPSQSAFYTEISTGKMPPAASAKISSDDIAAVSAWITSLKPGAACN